MVEKWHSERLLMENEAATSKSMIQKLTQEYNKLERQFNDLRAQKLRMQEIRREEIEETGLDHHIELMTLRNRV